MLRAWLNFIQYSSLPSYDFWTPLEMKAHVAISSGVEKGSLSSINHIVILLYEN